MRLHSLRLQAFGPFATEQRIDFDPLGAGGLFLLDGPTGAGKSTVLDAITFALYGPGDGGGWGRLHSHFAEPGTTPSVTLEFSLRGVWQRVTRSPEYPRPKRRGTGVTLERTQVHLERFEGGRWVSRSSRKDEVGEMLGDDLGLTRDQFTQVVLLPQGEFARFLRASDDERRGLLTKLFGTQLYDRITDELDRRRKLVSGDLDDAAGRLRARASAAGKAAGLDAAGQDALAALAPGDRDARLDAIAAELAAAVDRATALAEQADAALSAAQAARRAADARADTVGRLVTAAERLAAHEATRASYEQAADLLAAADRAEPVRPLLAALDDAATTLAHALRQVPADAVDSSAAQWSTRADMANASAAELRHLVASEQRLPDLRNAVAAARRELDDAEATRGRLAARAATLPPELEAARCAQTAARSLADTVDALAARVDAITARRAAAAELERTTPEHAAARAARDAAADRYLGAADEHLRLGEARLQNMAAELAAGLEPATACPVCGALDHPAPAEATAGAVDAAMVAAALQRRRAAEADRDAAAARLAELDLRRAALVERIGDDVPDREALTTARAELAAARAAGEDLPALVTAVAELEGEGVDLATAQRDAAGATARCQAALEAANADLAALDDELADARGPHESVAARRTALLAEAAAAACVASALAALDVARQAQHAADTRARAEASAIGFAELADAAAAVQPTTRRAELRVLVQQWAATRTALAAGADAAEFAGLSVEDVEPASAAAEQAARRLHDAEQQAQACAVAADRARWLRTGFADARVALAEAAAEHERLTEAAGPVVHLARLARGVAGRRRVNLTTYVLRQWFEQVVAAANVRLAGMSSGRYELVRVDEGANRTERTGLTVQVLDRHTGEQRSARSLSGGETFYTSLALALGLADVVRAEAGGVDLDTLFIDEGFGSLDADTLDQVMAVIDELRDRGRTVGIVSHVSELKNRIAERIEVRRLPDGSSALRVVA